MALYSKVVVRAAGGGLVAELDPRLSGELSPGTALEAVCHGKDALLLLRPGAAVAGYLAGSLQSISLAEVFNLIVSGVRSGTLVVGIGAARKTVSFRNGQISFATSTEPHERLGSALVRLGVVSRKELEAALAQVKPGHKLGQVLTGAGRVKPSVLYGALTFLVREIVVDLFQAPSGEFVFLEGTPGGEDVLRLPERTRDLVLEGIRRGEETFALRRKLPPALRVRLGRGPASAEHEAVRSRLAGGPQELAGLRSAFEGSDYGFLGWVNEALGTGELEEVTQLKRVAVAPPPDTRTTLQLYSALVETITTALLGAGKDLDALRAFLDDPQPGTEPAFAGVTLSDRGELDVQQVMKNLAPLGPVVGRARAYEALNAFVSYALFSAKNQLPRELADDLDQQMIEFMEKVQ